jgi:hypothetical protein
VSTTLTVVERTVKPSTTASTRSVSPLLIGTILFVWPRALSVGGRSTCLAVARSMAAGPSTRSTIAVVVPRAMPSIDTALPSVTGSPPDGEMRVRAPS